nr:RNA-directed DNA polymerase, eukaryota, reverse transcriptase zinc-binding domain protein [Tanacetum cinerariifolium]
MGFFHGINDNIKLTLFDVINDVIGYTGILLRECNTSFIALIPKDPNPMVISDFRPISLIRAQYKIIMKVMANHLARVIDSVISHEQIAFIKHRQILDGPLMVNEAKLMVFKIDFKKAFDSVSWDFLFQVMHFMGFSEKWISGYLYLATSSILINGSPTRKFNINCGLHQGDPLSPFLFIIAIKGLYVAVKDAMVVGLYRGLKVNTLTLSYLFFVDDALFIGEWSRANIKSMVSILECFHRVSGLKINFHKSNLFGVGVPFEEVNHFASISGCNARKTPFSYFGLPIDCNMAKTKSWDPIFEKFSKHLSKCKSLLLSIGTPTFMDKSTRKQIDQCTLPNGGFETRWNYFLPKKINIYIWRVLRDRLSTRWNLSKKGINMDSLSSSICDTGIETTNHLDDMCISSSQKSILEVICGVVLWSLWNSRSEMIFGTSSSRRSTFDKIVDCSYRISGVILSNMQDRWIWSFEASGDFLVTSVCRLIDDYLLPKGDVQTRWGKVVPIKVNVFTWRVRLDKLPTRLNLSLRGVEISSITCPLCNSSVESASHLSFRCHVARIIWKKVLRLLRLENESIFYSRDVKFYETMFPFKIKKNVKQTEFESGVTKDLNHKNFFDNKNPKRPNDERRVSSNNDGTELSPDIKQGNDDSEATSMDETNNTHPKGTASDETDFINKFYENLEFNYETEELPVNTLRSVEPTCYKEAILDSNWIDAMNAEIKALNENNTWVTLTYLLTEKLLKINGFTKSNINLVVILIDIRCVIALSVTNNWHLFQLDINNAFLYMDLDEDIYMTIPKGFASKDNKNKVCKLVKFLYGLKQAPRKWNEKLVSIL